MAMIAARAKPRRSSLAQEEERAWVSFYRRAGKDPAIAAEVLAQLDADAEMKREHLALYLRCRESLRLQQAREVRHRRIGQFVRWLLRGLFVGTPEATRRAMGRAGDLAVACLPNDEPAVVQVQRLSKDPKVRNARAAFRAPAASGAPAPDTVSATADSAPTAARAGG